jgi:ribonuclease HI
VPDDDQRTYVLHVDGGARGNPGPAAIGVVISDPAGSVVDQIAETIGETTNNVAEYRALLRGLERAAELGAQRVEVINDSELVAKQVNGVYKVKHPDMQALHAQARTLLSKFGSWSISSVPRRQNAGADQLVNQALDAAATRR